VRQGGILSPLLFNVYVDCMLTSLRKLDYGCHYGNNYLGCIMYADDLLLISASVSELQVMLNTCGDIGSKLSIMFNGSKSKCLVIGPNKIKNISTLTLNGASLIWEHKIKYLGIWLCSGKSFEVDLSEVRRKFFASVNSILSKCKYNNEIIKLQLLESQCLPILLYATECLILKPCQLSKINSWWNSVYRKIFGYNKWESVRKLICSLKRLDLLHIVNLRSMSFAKRVHDNVSFGTLIDSYVFSGQFISVLNKYNSQFIWSVSKLKAMLFLDFEEQCDCA
jgi:Reverse transcriptase (RNA-dependent DNA polymerase)